MSMAIFPSYVKFPEGMDDDLQRSLATDMGFGIWTRFTRWEWGIATNKAKMLLQKHGFYATLAQK